MSDLAVIENGATLSLWKDENKIKDVFAPDLTDIEFDFFVSLGSALQANPFTREIWAVKYGQQPAAIFLGRDFYRRKAQEQPNYDSHLAEAIYSNDTFKVVNGEVLHEYNMMDRGKLIGAYCIVWRKGSSKPYYHSVKIDEYIGKKKDGTVTRQWRTQPETMIKKVAESQALRGAFQGVFKGTYGEGEYYRVMESQKDEPDNDLNAKLQQARGVEVAEAVEIDPPEPELEQANPFEQRERDWLISQLHDQQKKGNLPGWVSKKILTQVCEAINTSNKTFEQTKQLASFFIWLVSDDNAESRDFHTVEFGKLERVKYAELKDLQESDENLEYLETLRKESQKAYKNWLKKS